MSTATTQKTETTIKPKARKSRKAVVDKLTVGVREHYSKLVKLDTLHKARLDVTHLWDNRFRINLWEGDPATKNNFVPSVSPTHSWFAHAEKRKTGKVVIVRDWGGVITVYGKNKK